MPGMWEEEKHPRGYGGRFSSGPGQSSNAHAMRPPARPRPPDHKIDHAVVPRIATRPSGISIQRGVSQAGD